MSQQQGQSQEIIRIMRFHVKNGIRHGQLPIPFLNSRTRIVLALLLRWIIQKRFKACSGYLVLPNL